MKSILPFAVVVALAIAETPSNSYLPPPPSRGYPQAQSSAPTIIAARTLEQSHSGDDHHHGAAAGSTSNGFARSGLQGHGNHGAYGQDIQTRSNSNEEPGYDHNAAAFGRNALDDANSEPASYNFGYMVNDYQEGTEFGHHESREEARAQGEYHVVLPDGRRQTVSYEADERGFKPQISYEDSEDLARSGYDSNANNFRTSSSYHGNEQDGAHSNNFRSNVGYHGNDQDGVHGNARSNGYN